ncbi:bifunctional precorrin-2 dehydrogenase/sirohydrochlorin ferrochelatase, partial [Devosia sp.]|uniref:precorrin-2 dehydrogenase/sirohydrochlorin ferrochelatase family protein n=1 Tax=Devosia sp. TaxID=1871048 RepID=UPI0027329CEE
MRIVSPQPNKARIAPLAVLPVFFDLIDKRVIAIGGSEPATWKIGLLAAAGAHVQVLAPVETWCQELIALAESGTAAGSISLVDCHWAPSDLSGAALAVADIEDDDEAAAFVDAARHEGVPYNVIDRPAFCQFQFGAIVNRSPVVIGVSTAGAAPILGQAVRRRIETLLPHTLSAWARLAQDVRGAVMTQLDAGPQRRAFWEKLAERAFGDAGPTAADARITSAGRTPAPGRVTLVGAGPGDADLLTIKAVRA